MSSSRSVASGYRSHGSRTSGPRGRLQNKRGLRKRKRRHRKFHHQSLQHRETSWFQAYDYIHNSIYFYDENDQSPEEISHWERPNELLSEEYLTKEWDITLDPTTSHYFFTSRYWVNLVVWHVPRDIDFKRFAHLERKRLRLRVATNVVEEMISTLENLNNSRITFWPHNTGQENHQLEVSWNTRSNRGGDINVVEGEILYLKLKAEEENEDDVKDEDEASTNDTDDEDEETSVFVSVAGEIDEHKEITIEGIFKGQSAMNIEAEEENEAITNKPLAFLEWVITTSPQGTDNVDINITGSGEEYETREHSYLKDIVEAMVCAIEEMMEKEAKRVMRLEEEQKELEIQRVQEEQLKLQEKEGEGQGDLPHKDNSTLNVAAIDTADTADTANVDDNTQGKDWKKRDADNALLSALWVSMSHNDHKGSRKSRLRSVAQAITYASISHLEGIPPEFECMSAYHHHLGTMWKQRDDEQREVKTKLFLNDMVNTLIYQHEKWDGNQARQERAMYFEALLDQYMVRSYGENYMGRATTAGSTFYSKYSSMQSIEEKQQEGYSDDEESEGMLVDGQGKVSRSQHYSRFQFLANCWYFGFRAASLIASLLKQKTKSRLVKWNQHKLLSNIEFLTLLGQAFSENMTALGIKMEGDPNDDGKQITGEGVNALFQESLQQNNTIVMLHLGYNNMGSMGGNILFESMRVNSRLHELDVSNNKLDEKVAPLIAACLRENNVLATLKLSQNLLGDTGVDIITDALWDNKGLRHLDVSACQIGDAGLFLLSRNIRKSQHLKKLDLQGNLFMILRACDIRTFWKELNPYKTVESVLKEQNEQKEKTKHLRNSDSNNGSDSDYSDSDSIITRPESNDPPITNDQQQAVSNATKEKWQVEEEQEKQKKKQEKQSQQIELSERDRLLSQHDLSSDAEVIGWPHYNMINHKMRSHVVVMTVRGDDRAKPSSIVQSVLGCIIGAVERYADADVPGNNLPAAQMKLGHFYNIALEEGDDHLFTPGDPDVVLQGKRQAIIRDVVSGLVNTMEVYYESAGTPVNKLEISLVLKKVIDAVVGANLIKTPEMIAIEMKARQRDLDKERKKTEEEKLEKKVAEEAADSSSEEASSDEEGEEEEREKEEKENKLDPKDLQEIEWVLEDALKAVLNTDESIDWKDDHEYNERSVASLVTQWTLLRKGIGPYHQGHRRLMRSRLTKEESIAVRRAYDTLNQHRRNNIKVQQAYDAPGGGVNMVEVILDAVVNAVAWCDLSTVEDGLTLLDGEKGPFNMHARKIRKKKRAELEALRIELLTANYPPHFDRAYQEHLETDDNERIVLKMCYGVNTLHEQQHKRDLQRQEDCRPVVECMLESVLSWQTVVEAKETEAELLASRTPRTVEKQIKDEEKADNKRLKEIKKEHKKKKKITLTQEEAEDLLYLEKNPPQKSETEELTERYEAACTIMFSPDATAERQRNAIISEEAATAAEIPTVRLRVECAKALKNADLIGLSDPFVVVFDSAKEVVVQAEDQSIGKTQVVDDSLEPVWEEAFDVKIGDMTDFLTRKFRFEVYDYDVIGDNEFLGACQLNGEEIMERCGKPNKYWNLNGMKGKSMQYVQGRLKLGFDLLGAGGFSPGNDVYSETLDIPEEGDTPLDFLAYGLFRSGIELIRLDSNNWLPIRHVLGKVPAGTETPEEKEQVRTELETCNQLRGMHMTSMEQGLIIKCAAMNSLVEHLDWSCNSMEATDIMSMCWLFQESKSLEHVDLHRCGMNASAPLSRFACAAITQCLVTSYRPQTIRLSSKGGFLPVQRLIGRGLNDSLPEKILTMKESCLDPITRILTMSEPIHVMDDIVVANLIWLSTAHINAKEEERLLAAKSSLENEEEEKKKKEPEDSQEEEEDDDFGGSSENAAYIDDDDDGILDSTGPHELIYSSIEAANGVHIRPDQQLVDYAKRHLHQFEVSYLGAQLRPADTCRVIYLSFEACGLDCEARYAVSSSSLLMNALQTNRSVTDLNLSDNDIGSHHDCGAALNRLLSSNNALLSLNLSRNPLGFSCKPAPSSSSGPVCAMASGLSQNTNLRELSLSDCCVQAKGVEALGVCLSVNTSLLTLDLSRNRGITRYGTVCLANGLCANHGLETLDCAGCSMGMAGATVSNFNMLKSLISTPHIEYETETERYVLLVLQSYSKQLVVPHSSF